MSRQWKVPVTEGSVLPVFSVKTQNCYFFPMKYNLTSFKNYKLEKVNYYYGWFKYSMDKRIWKRSSQEWTLSSSENNSWKKFRPARDLTPWPLQYRWSALPTELLTYMIFIYLQSFIWIQFVSGFIYYTFLVPKYSIPLAIWKAYETKSLIVKKGPEWLSVCCWYSDGLLSLRNCRRFPCGANSTTTNRGPETHVSKGLNHSFKDITYAVDEYLLGLGVVLLRCECMLILIRDSGRLLIFI